MFVYRRVITWDKWFHVSFQKFPLLALQPAWLSMENPPFWRVVRCGEYYISKNKREIDIAWIPGMHGYPPKINHYFFQTTTFLWGFLGNSHGCPPCRLFRFPPWSPQCHRDPCHNCGIWKQTSPNSSLAMVVGYLRWKWSWFIEILPEGLSEEVPFLGDFRGILARCINLTWSCETGTRLSSARMSEQPKSGTTLRG